MLSVLVVQDPGALTGLGTLLAELTDTVRQLTGLHPETQARLARSLIIVLLLALLRALALRVMRHRVEDLRSRYRWSKAFTYLTVLLGFILVGRVWFQGVQSLMTYLGVLSAGIAIALRDPIVNFAGWLFIVWRRPFVVGDRIAVAENAGDVIDVRVFQFTMLEIGKWVAADQSTGRIIHVPNGKVFTEPIANYTRGFQYIWNEIPVFLTFESNWRRAKSLLRDIAERHAEQLTSETEQRLLQASRRFMIFYTTLRPIVYTSVGENGVVLTVRYLCEPRRRRGSAERIWEDVLEAFAAAEDIAFAYPTRRLVDNLQQGGAAASEVLAAARQRRSSRGAAE
ncbi:MAG: mechanosensitive ion channel family protein [Longimicrobiales bacterium]